MADVSLYVAGRRKNVLLILMSLTFHFFGFKSKGYQTQKLKMEKNEIFTWLN